ncbi:MAG: hypothetical protein Q7U20_09345 [Caulobacter sp.]|nr:hypothetical protein [Caulobacter sp.]
MKTLTRLMTAIGAALVVVAAAGPSQAYPDQAAGIDAQIRPNFGGLITPPLRPRWRPDRWQPRQNRPRRGGGYYTGARFETSLTVDCNAPVQDDYGPGSGTGYAPPRPAPGYGSGPAGGQYDDQDSGQYPSNGPLNDALQRLADYGTLYVRGTCRETLWIEHPVAIVGAAASIFADSPAQRATIIPADGSSCVKVAPGVDGVELRDLILQTEKGGRAPCVETWDSKVALVRTTVRYWGDTAAVFASGGELRLIESFIDARTWDAAVVSDGAVLKMSRTRVLAEEAGIDVTPGVGDSLIEQSGIMGRDAALPAGNGILVRGQRSGSGALKINNAVVCGWRNGLHLDRGSIVEVNRSRFCRTTVGVVTDGDLTLTESAIGSREVGLYAATGKATVKRNRFYGWSSRPLWIEQGVVVDLEPNYAYYNDDCWKRSGWEQGVYCQRSTGLPSSLRDESGFTNPYRDWWEADGYDRAYQRDGPPSVQPYPVRPPPPAKPPRRFGRRAPSTGGGY